VDFVAKCIVGLDIAAVDLAAVGLPWRVISGSASPLWALPSSVSPTLACIAGHIGACLAVVGLLSSVSLS
jgi:hypothetical protein